MLGDVQKTLNKYANYIAYIDRLNKALDTVGYNAKVNIVTLKPYIAVIHGKQAKSALTSVISSGHTNSYNEIWSKGIYAGKAFILELVFD